MNPALTSLTDAQQVALSNVFTCKLLAAKDVSPGGAATATPGAKAQSNASRTVLRGVLWGLGVLLLLVAAALIVRTINLQRRNRRNRQYNYRYRTTTRRRK